MIPVLPFGDVFVGTLVSVPHWKGMIALPQTKGKQNEPPVEVIKLSLIGTGERLIDGKHINHQEDMAVGDYLVVMGAGRIDGDMRQFFQACYDVDGGTLDTLRIFKYGQILFKLTTPPKLAATDPESN